jgi:seryl-tRNA synthetase
MTVTLPAGLAAIGLRWYESGQAGLGGPLLRLAEDCDRAFVTLAGIWQAGEERHPAALPAERLQRLDYLHSFPHQATFPARLDPAHLNDFLAGELVTAAGDVALSPLAPVSSVLTPAACYHLYHAHEGQSFTAPLHLTTRNTCFRYEDGYEPLRRQWSFTMREIVCLGTHGETVSYLEQARAAVDELLALIDLPVAWLAATDPFFQPRTNPQYLMQRLQPSKHEATYGGDLAIASVNLHHDHFGEAFRLQRDGQPVNTACLAFGLERWLYALTDRHGLDPASWPSPAEAAATVVRRRTDSVGPPAGEGDR